MTKGRVILKASVGEIEIEFWSKETPKACGEQPVIYPPKIKSIRIVDNPFDDIVPRIEAAEKRVQQLAREEAPKKREEAARRKSAKGRSTLYSE
ncbi:uncharacterized protein EI90DRAFT_3126822 [Cantharellus anzutake]|uniref:uncharacterized protein n=1 Tax=Cantharellus anzutake TaxID=1750568 RepID=UPI001908E05E|nr:uncharacterized protein EI90DRAFT_3126822 [Cantharellus anzutake]KAF8327818.1 hypothetical protein EI90DRAFT_3126822 [Cantharellus anzutake]